MNRVILVGRITRDPELKQTNSNISYVQFTLAVNRSYKNASGERQADFINCVAWRQTAEVIARYITKGAQIGIEGQLQTRQYDDPNGITRYITEVIVDNFHFLEPRRSQETSPYDDFSQITPPRTQAPKPQQQTQQTSTKQESPFDTSDSTYDISGDDLPF